MFRIIQETNPSWIIGENVSGIINLELEQVCTDLESEGYEVQPFIIPACAVNAPHRRDRVWIVANSERIRWKRRDGDGGEASEKDGEGITTEFAGSSEAFIADPRCIGQEKPEIKTMGSEQLCGNVTDSASEGLEGANSRKSEHSERPRYNRNELWDENWIEVATRLCGVDARVPNRVDRLKCLGNSVVPQIVEIIGHYIMEWESGFSNSVAYQQL